MTGSTLTVLRDVLGETDKKLSAVEKSYKQLEKDLKTFKKDGKVTAQNLRHLKNTLKLDIKDCKDSLREIRNSFTYSINPNVSKTILNIEKSLIQTGAMLNNVEGCFGDISNALEAYKTTLDSGTDDIKATKDYVAGIQKDIRKKASKRFPGMISIMK